jgi:predicted Zn finger-like uncharacterized protein
MDNLIDVTCTNCSTKLRVKDSLAGKRVKCKKCEAILTIPVAAKPLPAEFAKPAKTAKPVAKAKPAAPPPAADAPLALAKNDDGEDDANPYGVIREGDAPRCPHCAKELDPPEATLCLNCGYDLQDRKRKESRAVIEHTFGDYFKHHIGAICLTLLAIGLIAISIVCWIYMEDWVGPWVANDEKDPTTQKSGYYVKPWCFSLWICMMIIWIDYKIFKFCFKRFFVDYTPGEKLLKKND